MTDFLSRDSETPRHGEQVITASACIHRVCDGVEKIFMPRRAHTKKFLPGVYELPGGHIDFSEDIVVGLKREIMEEFGMRIRVGDPFAVFTYMNEVKGSHSIEVDYFAEFEDPIENIRVNLEDHESFVWIAEDEIKGVVSEGRSGDDPEIRALRRAFALLNGGRLSFS